MTAKEKQIKQEQILEKLVNVLRYKIWEKFLEISVTAQTMQKYIYFS
jgi:hypothetical protein